MRILMAPGGSAPEAWATGMDVRSGVNMYIKRIYDTCWKLKGICRNTCQKEEIYHIFCGIQSLCCLEKKEMPVLFVK
uniref:Beta-defensin n=2 Tax=Mus TaxID=862507 RepID=D3YYK2_MOUSE